MITRDPYVWTDRSQERQVLKRVQMLRSRVNCCLSIICQTLRQSIWLCNKANSYTLDWNNVLCLCLITPSVWLFPCMRGLQGKLRRWSISRLSPSPPFFFKKNKWKPARTHQFHSLGQGQPILTRKAIKLLHFTEWCAAGYANRYERNLLGF